MQRTRFLDITEKLVSCLTYPSCGVIGLIWIILYNIIFKKNPRPIITYHIYLSIILWLLIGCASFILAFFINLIIKIPIFGSWIANFVMFFNTPIYFGLSIINLFITLIMLYLMLCALLGRYSKLPFLSNVAKLNVEKSC